MRNMKNWNRNPRKKQYKGPFPENKYATFQYVLKNMRMLDDGPTVNEFTQIDTTEDCFNDDDYNNTGKRKVANKTQITNWFSDNIKQVIIGIVVAVVAGVFLYFLVDQNNLVITHNVKIEEITKDVQEHDHRLEKVEEKVRKVESDQNRLEQKVDFNEAKTELKYVKKKER